MRIIIKGGIWKNTEGKLVIVFQFYAQSIIKSSWVVMK